MFRGTAGRGGMRSAFLLIAVPAMAGILSGAPVSDDMTRTAAARFAARSPAFSGRSSYAVNGVLPVCAASSRTVLARVVTFASGGFCILTGDDRLSPLLGYSEQSIADLADVPENGLLPFLRASVGARLAVIEGIEGKQGRGGNLTAVEEAVLVEATAAGSKWQALLAQEESGSRTSRDWEVNVGPLIPALWGQCYDAESMWYSCTNKDATFNYYTPEVTKSGYPVNAYTGCVATAMAQAMKYFDWPPRGTGSHTYTWTHPDSGDDIELSTDFSAHTYDWDSMVSDYYRPCSQASPNSTDAQREAVGRLMYDCGVGVDMAFSGSSSLALLQAGGPVLEDHFFYNTTTYYSTTYGDIPADMLARIRENVVDGLPTCAQLNNHVVNVDGVRREEGGSTDLYHINFGYQGRNNGWYSLASGFWTNQAEGLITQYYFPAYDGNFWGTVGKCLVDIMPGVYTDDLGGNGSGTFTVTWQTSARLTVQNYELQQSTTARGRYSWATISAALQTPSYAFTDKPLGTYYFRARAQVGGTWGAWSNVVPYEVVPIPQRDLTLVAGSGGTTDPAPGTYTYDQGTVVRIEAIPDEHHNFVNWTDARTSYNDNPLDFTVDAHTTLTANFSPKQYTVTVVSPHGTPTPAVGTQLLDYGTELSPTCSGSPEAGGVDTRYALSGWRRETDSRLYLGNGAAVPPFTVEEDTTVTWLWHTEYVVDSQATAGGTVSATWLDGEAAALPAWCPEKERLVLRAQPEEDKAFEGWAGDVPTWADAAEKQLVVAPTAPTAVTATFAALVDSDLDDMHDAWELTYWPSVDHDDADPEDNPDGDAFTNLEEHDNGTDPLVPTCRLNAGWTLIATSLTPSNSDTIAEQLPELASPCVWRWDAGNCCYGRVRAGNPEQIDRVLLPTHAYWVFCTTDLFVDIGGTAWADGTRALPSGWSLVGGIYGGVLAPRLAPPGWLWEWSGSDYAQAQRIISACGYWLRLADPQTVELP